MTYGDARSTGDDPGARPGAVVMVVGTATEIGKTWVACSLAEHLIEAGLTVVARKPAQSFEPGDDLAGDTDAHLLAAATGDRPHEVTPSHRWYPVALAPPMAAAALGRPEVRISELIDELAWPAGTDVGLLETAGGVRSPLAVDGDAVVLAARLQPDLVVLVADAGLGTIGAVRSAADDLAGRPLHVLLNRFDPDDDTHRRNLAWLRHHDGFVTAATVGELVSDASLRGAR